jgi:hypothetical protein
MHDVPRERWPSLGSAWAGVVLAGVLTFAGAGCGGTQQAAVTDKGGAPTDTDDADRTKAMEDFMNSENKK